MDWHQCAQIGRFIGLWATYQSLWQQLVLPKSPTFLGNFCKGVKFFYFSSELILGQLFTGHIDWHWVCLSFRVEKDIWIPTFLNYQLLDDPCYTRGKLTFKLMDLVTLLPQQMTANQSPRMISHKIKPPWDQNWKTFFAVTGGDLNFVQILMSNSANKMNLYLEFVLGVQIHQYKLIITWCYKQILALHC